MLFGGGILVSTHVQPLTQHGGGAWRLSGRQGSVMVVHILQSIACTRGSAPVGACELGVCCAAGRHKHHTRMDAGGMAASLLQQPAPAARPTCC